MITFSLNRLGHVLGHFFRSLMVTFSPDSLDHILDHVFRSMKVLSSLLLPLDRIHVLDHVFRRMIITINLHALDHVLVLNHVFQSMKRVKIPPSLFPLDHVFRSMMVTINSNALDHVHVLDHVFQRVKIPPSLFPLDHVFRSMMVTINSNALDHVHVLDHVFQSMKFRFSLLALDHVHNLGLHIQQEEEGGLLNLEDNFQSKCKISMVHLGQNIFVLQQTYEFMKRRPTIGLYRRECARAIWGDDIEFANSCLTPDGICIAFPEIGPTTMFNPNRIELFLNVASVNQLEFGALIEHSFGREESTLSTSDNSSIQDDSSSDYFSIQNDTSEDESSSDDDSSSSENEIDDKDNFDELLYPGAPITVGESLIMILKLTTRFEMTGVCLASILQTIAAHCIQPNKCITTLYKFKKIFSNIQVPLTRHYFCGLCFSKLEDQYCSTCENQENIRYFLGVSIIEQLNSFFKREEFRQHLNYRFDRNKQNEENYEDLYDGSIYKSVPNDYTLNPNNLTFTWNTDGVPLFKSSKISIWPFLLMINELPYRQRIKKENLILAGLWFGTDKPNPNLFMSSLVHELDELFQGIQIEIGNPAQQIQVRGLIISGTCDLPAVALFRNMKQYNSTYGCTNCLIETQRYENVQTYPYVENYVLRTTEQTRLFAIEAHEANDSIFGVKGPTALSVIAYDHIAGMTIYVMHNLYQGCMKKLISLWFDVDHRNEDFSLVPYTNIVNDRIKALTLLSCIPRNPRKVNRMNSKTYINYIVIPTNLIEVE
ncbi:hypothetical protein TKK_0007701 [Trichogramma kaykai]